MRSRSKRYYAPIRIYQPSWRTRAWIKFGNKICSRQLGRQGSLPKAPINSLSLISTTRAPLNLPFGNPPPTAFAILIVEREKDDFQYPTTAIKSYSLFQDLLERFPIMYVHKFDDRTYSVFRPLSRFLRLTCISLFNFLSDTGFPSFFLVRKMIFLQNEDTNSLKIARYFVVRSNRTHLLSFSLVSSRCSDFQFPGTISVSVALSFNVNKLDKEHRTMSVPLAYP